MGSGKIHVAGKEYTELQFQTFFDELAEMGNLEAFVEEYMEDRFAQDGEFRREIYDTLFKNSPVAAPLLERYILEKMCESLGYFLEYTKQWNKLRDR